MASELTWDYAAAAIPRSGLRQRRSATPEELSGVAAALDLVTCKELSAEFSLVPTVEGRYQLKGQLHATVVQTCVVTLEPVEVALEESFDVAFWPHDDLPPPASGEVDIEEEDAPEGIVGGQLAVGHVVFECLAAAIDPFPKKPGAVLDWHVPTPEGDTDGAQNPFAVLARLKAKG
jgi:uncharacterized metal-binding protein YceD (DUF177 family)